MKRTKRPFKRRILTHWEFEVLPSALYYDVRKQVVVAKKNARRQFLRECKMLGRPKARYKEVELEDLGGGPRGYIINIQP